MLIIDGYYLYKSVKDHCNKGQILIDSFIRSRKTLAVPRAPFLLHAHCCSLHTAAACARAAERR